MYAEIDREKIQTGIRQLEEELLTRPDDPVLLNNLGANHSMLEDHRRAIEFYDRALSKSGDYRLARNNRCIALLAIGNVYADNGEFDEASRLYESALPDADSDLLADLHYNLGIVKFRQSDWQGAMQSFNTSRAHRNGNDRDTLINLGASKSENNNQRWALEDYREASTMPGSDDEDLYNNMGVSYARLSETGDTEDSLNEAISYFKRSLTLTPDLRIAAENLRVCESELETYRQSLAEKFSNQSEGPSNQTLEPLKVSDEEIEKFLDKLGNIPADPYRLLKVAERTFQNQEGRFWELVSVQFYSNAVPILLDTILVPKVREHPFLAQHLRQGNYRDFAYHVDYLFRIKNDKSLTEMHLGRSHRRFADDDRIQLLIDLIRASSSTGGNRPLAHGNPEDQPVIPDKIRRIVLGTLVYPDGEEGIIEILFDLTKGGDR